MSVTIKELAEKLNLSPSAISIALNGKPGVSEATRELILAEAERLGYKQRKSHGDILQNIRFVIFLGDREDAVRETSFYSYVLQGIEDCAKGLGYNVLVSYYKTDEDTSAQLNSLSSNSNGIILLGTAINRSHLPQLEKMRALGLPMVMVDNYIEDFPVDCVVSDNARGVYNATKHLLKKGYDSLGYIRSKLTIDNFTLRQKGFNKACRRSEMSKEPVFIDVGISSQMAFDDMVKWLEAGNIPPRALIADNDVLAAACIRALKSKGYRIPEDVAVIGFDNMPVCAMIDPPLSAIDVNKKMIGWLAMTFLYKRIQDINSGRSARINDALLTYVSANLIERESS